MKSSESLLQQATAALRGRLSRINAGLRTPAMKLSGKTISTILLFIIALVFFSIISQTFSADEQIFITDSYFIAPKTQPILYVLLMLVNIGLIVFAIYLGLRIAGFLARKKILFEIVGVFLIITALVLSYFFLIMGKNIETTKDFIIMLVLILFVGIIGLLMIFSSKLNKGRK